MGNRLTDHRRHDTPHYYGHACFSITLPCGTRLLFDAKGITLHLPPIGETVEL